MAACACGLFKMIGDEEGGEMRRPPFSEGEARNEKTGMRASSERDRKASMDALHFCSFTSS